MSKYAPTTDAGQTRTRARAINIRLPVDQPLTLEVLEQVVVRVAGNGEVAADNQAGRIEITDSPDTRAMSFPLRSFETDQEIGGSSNGAEVLTGLYSMIRALQEDRDEQAVADNG